MGFKIGDKVVLSPQPDETRWVWTDIKGVSLIGKVGLITSSDNKYYDKTGIYGAYHGYGVTFGSQHVNAVIHFVIEGRHLIKVDDSHDDDQDTLGCDEPLKVANWKALSDVWQPAQIKTKVAKSA